MRMLGSTVLSLGLLLGLAAGMPAQQLDSAQREVWRTVEARWRAWRAGDLETMLSLHHPRFHRWNPVTGALQARDSLPAQWRRMRQAETVDAVALEPVAVDVYGDFAAAHYVSHETVRLAPAAPPVVAGRAPADEPIEVAIRWSDYLVRDGGRWLYVGGARINCSPLEGAGSACRPAPANDGCGGRS